MSGLPGLLLSSVMGSARSLVPFQACGNRNGRKIWAFLMQLTANSSDDMRNVRPLQSAFFRQQLNAIGVFEHHAHRVGSFALQLIATYALYRCVRLYAPRTAL